MWQQHHSWRNVLSRAIAAFALGFCDNLYEIHIATGMSTKYIKGWHV